MATWLTYRGLDVPDNAPGDAGGRLKSDLQKLADGAPHAYAGDPTINDDTSLGYAAGALWWNTSSQILWVCTDATTSNAKWKSLFRRVDSAIVLAPSALVGGGTDNRALQFDAGTENARGTNAVDLQRVRTTITQVAAGNQSAIIGGENNVAFSVDSFVGGGKGNNAGGGSGTITNVTIANPTVVTSANHGLTTGQLISISGTSTTPTINGNRTVTVTGANTFTVPVNVTGVSVVSGSWTSSATAAYAFVGGGQNNKAIGKWSHAEGFNTTAAGWGSHAEGRITTASGFYAHAEGRGASASGIASHAECYQTSAVGFYSHAEGYRTAANSIATHAEGYGSTAGGTCSHAEGRYSVASGYGSHAEGDVTTANSLASHAEGFATTAGANYSHVGGSLSKALLKAQWARASGGHSGAAGSAQTTISHLFRATTDETVTELTIGGVAPSGGTGRIVVRNNQTLSCLINVVGRKVSGSSTEHGSFVRQICVGNNAGTATLVDNAVRTIGQDINPGLWGQSPLYDPIGISVDNSDQTYKVLKITVKGKSSTNIRWMATVISSEVADAQIS